MAWPFVEIPILLNETPLIVTVKPRPKPGPVGVEPVVSDAGSTYSWSSIVALPRVKSGELMGVNVPADSNGRRALTDCAMPINGRARSRPIRPIGCVRLSMITFLGRE